MKTAIYIAFILLTSFGLYSKQQDLFDRNWYATEMVVDGEAIPIPVLSVDSQKDVLLGLKYTHIIIMRPQLALICVGLVKQK